MYVVASGALSATRNDIVFGSEYLQYPRRVDRRAGEETAPGDAVRAVRADDDLGPETALICFDRNTLFIRNDVLDSDLFFNPYSPALCFLRQPVIELIAADDAQRVPPGNAEIQAPGFEIKMQAICIHVRHLAHIQPEALKNDLCVDDESARAKLGARVTRFLEDQDAGSKLREVSGDVKGGGESRRPTANDQDVTFRHILMLQDLGKE
jgi:hypothetical protein